ncbi:MAG: hypothetical protein H0W99_13265, partial [Acidobacteria bacterium]|nr:hypothetical protein [Acidobacteriota bacterium]
MREKNGRLLTVLLIAALVCAVFSRSASGQQRSRDGENENTVASGQGPRIGVRTVTIPITIREKGSKPQDEIMPVGEFVVREDGDAQRILSVRDIGNAPLSVAVLIQDDVVSSIGNEIKAMGEFIRRLPRGSRVMVGYIRSGSLQ